MPQVIGNYMGNVLILVQTASTYFRKANFDGTAFPKRAQRKAKLDQMESEIDQTGSQMRANIGPKCVSGVPREL